MKKITTTIMLVCLISLASAISYDITAGEPQAIPLQEDYVYHTLTGNSTVVNYTVFNNRIDTIVTFDNYTSQGTYELKFYNSKGEEIQQSQGGGGSRWSLEKKEVVVNETINETDNTTDEVKEIEDLEDEIEELKEDNKKTKIIIWTLVGMVAFVGTIFLIWSSRK